MDGHFKSEHVCGLYPGLSLNCADFTYISIWSPSGAVVLDGNSNSIVQGAPTTYNKDFQEAWPLMFDSVDTVSDCIKIATGVISTLKINPDKMRAGLSADMLATDLAEYLVRKGGP